MRCAGGSEVVEVACRGAATGNAAHMSKPFPEMNPERATSRAA
jgi:hypothetical protein